MNKWIARAGFFALFFAGLYLVGILLGKTKPFEVQRQLDEKHPLRVQYEADVKTFNDESTAWIAVHRDKPFTTQEIEKIAIPLQDFLTAQKNVEAVVGPANAKYFIHDGQNLEIKKFLDHGAIPTEAEPQLKTTLWKNNLFSEDYTGFLLRFRFSRTLKSDDEKPLIDKIDRYLQHLQTEFPKTEIRQIGVKQASAHFLEEMYFQQRVMTPLLLLSLMVFFYWLFRSWQIVVWCFFTMFVCYVSTLVIAVLVEGGLGPYSSFALMFSFIVATTDLIQFFSRFQQLDGSVEQRLKETLKIASWPCLLTSLTTAAGFFALILNVNTSIRNLGLYCAFACMLEWFLIFYVLPPVLKIFNFNPHHKKFAMDKISEKYFSILDNYKKPIISISVAMILVGGLFAFKIKIDDNFYTKFKTDHALSKTIDFFSNTFNFVGSVDVILNIPTEQLFDEKLTLDHVKTIEAEILKDPSVSRVRSITQVNDILKQQLESKLTQPRAIEDSRVSALNLFKAYGEFNELYNDNSQQMRVVVFLKSFATTDFERVLNLIYKLQAQYKGDIELRPGGFSVIRSYINGQVIRDFFESFILGFILIFLCFLLLYRNFKWAFLALIPNAVPLLLVAGLIGLLQVSVGTDLVVILCISFGISGDNTIHLAYVLQNIRKEKPDINYAQALKKSMDLIGMAMIGSSGIFLFSLPVFFLGHLNIFHHIALFLSISFLLAFFSDLFTFPSIQLLSKDSLTLQLKKSNNK